MANWANDLVRGFSQGASIDATIDQTAERRKKAKLVGTVDSEMKGKLFDVEDKGTIGNFFYNKFGIGDPPQVTNKAATAPAAAPVSDARTAALRGADALKGLQTMSETGPAPEMLAMQEIGIAPIKTVSAATPTPMVPVPGIPEDGAPPSRYRRQVQQGIS